MENHFNIELELIVDEIHQLLVVACDRYQEHHQNIGITTWTQISNFAEHLKNDLENGFALINFNLQITPKNVTQTTIILNESGAREAGLTNDEIKAVILHELGHIFNEFEPLPPVNRAEFKNNTTGFFQATQDRGRINKVNHETYPDSYATRHGFTHALLSSFEKFNDWKEQPVGLEQERINAINQGNDFIGIINARFQAN